VDLLILGGGYTGQRVAARFLERGARVTITTRDPSRVPISGAEVIRLEDVPSHIVPGALVLHSIPPNGPSGVLDLLGDAPARIVYLSSTGVYGASSSVDERTPVDLRTERARARVEAERDIAGRPWSSLILRPAAIYGPGRGIQESMQRGGYSLSDTYVSRIHVDDLAAHVEAGLLSTITGAYPVADEEPCTSRQIAEFCAALLDVSLSGGHDEPSRFSSNRRVDGSAIRRLLGISLKYPSYRVGVPAALRAAGHLP
jgi:nucleoside-diphosphate-sugar epimerase